MTKEQTTLRPKTTYLKIKKQINFVFWKGRERKFVEQQMRAQKMRKVAKKNTTNIFD